MGFDGSRHLAQVGEHGVWAFIARPVPAEAHRTPQSSWTDESTSYARHRKHQTYCASGGSRQGCVDGT